MTIQVTGTLSDPTGDPLEGTLRVTAKDNNISLKGAYSNITIAADGLYDFNLEEGTYLVQLLQEDEFTSGSVIVVDGVTPTPITLGTLLKDHELIGG